MSSQPDADAFVAAILRNPADVTTRLVFADWLEETGDPSNVAWAHFIRLNAERASGIGDVGERVRLQTEAALWAAETKALITVPAAVLVAHSSELWQVVPPPNLSACLKGFEVPRSVIDYMPESAARENDLLPLRLQADTLLVALADPFDYDLLQKLQFILNKDIIPVRARREDLRNSIDSHYPATETESVTEYLVEFADVARDDTSPPVSSEPPGRENASVVRVVNLLLQDAIALGATAVRLTTEPGGIRESQQRDGVWHRRGNIPYLLWPGVVARLKVMAWIPLVMTDPATSREADGIAGAFRLTCFGIAHVVRVVSRREPTGLVIELTFARDVLPTLG